MSNTKAVAYQSSLGEIIANSVSHGVGIVLAISALGVLTAFSSIYGDAWHIVSCSIFGATLIFLYSASTLYHSIQLPKVNAILQILDHSAILLLIAGTYTPFTLVTLRGPWGWSIFTIVWGLAIMGIFLQVMMKPQKKKEILSVLLYVAMGWIILVAIKPMLTALPLGGLLLLLAGGITYTGGIAFFLWERLPYHHAIWHLFVLGGSTLHFFAVLFYVIPGGL